MRQLNALKHGGFAEATILPNEDPEEFKKLHDALIDDLDPEGPIEEDIVRSIADNLWRKRRFRRFMQNRMNNFEFLAQNARCWQKKWIKRAVAFCEDCEKGKLGSLTEDDLVTRLGQDWASSVKKAAPRAKFATHGDWLNEVRNVLLWSPLADVPDAGKVYSDEKLTERELALEERLDAKTARDIKALVQIKTLRSMGLGKRRPDPVASLPKAS
jgi:hypothetical protein